MEELKMEEFNCGSYSFSEEGISFHNKAGLVSIFIDYENFYKVVENAKIFLGMAIKICEEK